MISAGCSGIPFTSSIVSVNVPFTSGLASLLKPICVSLICTNNGLPIFAAPYLLSAAIARSMGVKTPPDRANRVPAPPYAMHFRALRRDTSDRSSDMALSFLVCSGEKTWLVRVLFHSKALGLFAQQAHQSQKLIPAGIGHGAILDIALLPVRKMVAAARGIAWAGSIRSPGEHVDDVRAVLVHDHRGALMVNVIGTPADQAITLRIEIGDCRGDIGVAGEPRLDRVPVRGNHVDQ